MDYSLHSPSGPSLCDVLRACPAFAGMTSEKKPGGEAGLLLLRGSAAIYNAANAALNVALGRIACASFAMSGL
jgi:hypothetical protein